MILFEYLGVDGSVWNLRTGPVRLGRGAQGLGLVGLTTFTQDNGPRDGQRTTGWRANPQEIHLPLKKGYPWDLSGQAYAVTDAAWKKAILPHLPGALRCTGPTGAQRTVAVRLTSDGPYTMDFDPSDVPAEDIDHTFLADVPWWLGPAQTVQFGVSSSAPFYGASGYGPPFYISAANSSGTQPLANPGDIDAWPVWTIFGPVSTFSIVPASGGQIAGAPNLAAGESLIIDTRPGASGKSATRLNSDGTSTPWTPNLTAADWRAIPAGGTSSLQVNLTGTGSAQATLQPQYFSAW